MKRLKSSIKGFLAACFLLALFAAQLGLPAGSQKIESWIPEAHAELTDAQLQARARHEITDAEGKTIDTKSMQEITTRVAKLSTYVNYVFNPFIHFLSFHIGSLLNNDYIFAGDMGEMLQNIWRVNRNIVNIIFVLVLLYLALKHIFSGEEGNTDLKKILPSFALMLVAVNFSWMAGKVVLDAANVATNVVFSLPAAVQGVMGEEALRIIQKPFTLDQNGKPKGSGYPSEIHSPTDAKYTLNLNGDAGECEGIAERYGNVYPADKVERDVVTPQPEKKDDPLFGVTTYCWRTMDFSKYNQNSASYFLSYSMARIQNLTETSNKGIAKVAIGVIFAIVIQLVYIVAFGSLLLALVFRIAALWFFIAFSPYLVLISFLKDKAQINVGGEGSLSITSFAEWAFAPAKVGAVWAIGFIMVSTGQGLSENFFLNLNERGEVSGKLYSIKSLFMGMENLQQFIWLIMTMAIIWIGTFAVLGKLKFAERVFNKIKDTGSDLATTVATSPLIAPVIPLYEGGEFKKMTSFKKTFGGLNERLTQLIEGGYKENVDHQRLEEGGRKLRDLTTTEKEEIMRLLKEANTAPTTERLDKLYNYLASRGDFKKEDFDTISGREAVKRVIKSSGIVEGDQVGQLMSLLERAAKNQPEAPVEKTPQPAAATASATATTQAAPSKQTSPPAAEKNPPADPATPAAP